MDRSTVIIIIIMGGIGLWVLLSKRKERHSVTRVVLVGRPVAPPSHVLRNIVVLAILAALGWLFWFLYVQRGLTG